MHLVPWHPLTFVILAAALLWTAFAAWIGMRRGTRHVPAVAVLRAVAIGLLAWALHAPERTTAVSRPAQLILLADASASVSPAEWERLCTQARRRLDALGDTVNATLIGFDRGAAPLELALPAGRLSERLAPGDWLARYPTDRQRTIHDGDGGLDAALALARSLLDPRGGEAEILLLSDCRFPPLPAATAARERLTYYCERDTVTGTDAALMPPRLPDAPVAGAPLTFSFPLTVEAAGTARWQVTALQQGQPAWSDSRDVTLAPGMAPLTAECPGLAAGRYDITATLHIDGDFRPGNNMQSAELTVAGAPRILLVNDDPAAARNILAAIAAAGLDIDVMDTAALRADMRRVADAPFVIFAGIRLDALGAAEWTALRGMLEASGAGALCIADASWDESTQLEWEPAHAVLPVMLRPRPDLTPPENPVDLARGPEAETPPEEPAALVADPKGDIEQEVLSPSIAVALLIDRSGSMVLDQRLEIAKAAALATLQALDGNDKIGVCAFDAAPVWLFRPTQAQNRALIEDGIKRLRPGGGTAFYPALESAKQELERQSVNIRHVILLSDGMSQAADFDKIATAMTRANITVSTVYIGDGEGREQMAQIALSGKGAYYPVATGELAEVPRIFTADIRNRVREFEKLHPPKAPQQPRTDIPATTPTHSTPQGSERKPSPELLQEPAIKPDATPPPATTTTLALRLAQPALFTRDLKDADLPAIRQCMLATAKPGARVAIATQDGGIPILVEQPLGLGRVFYLGTDTYRWGGPLADWDGFANLLQRVVAAGMRSPARQRVQFDDTLARHGTNVRLSFLTYGQDGKPLVDLENELILHRDDGGETAIPVRTAGMGYYAADLPLSETPGGVTRVTLTQRRQGELLNRKEYRLAADLDEEHLARYLPPDMQSVLATPDWKAADANAPLRPASGSTSEPLTLWLLVAAIACFPLELALRRFWN